MTEAENLVEQGNALGQAGDVNGAEHAYRAAIASSPEWSVPYAIAASICLAASTCISGRSARAVALRRQSLPARFRQQERRDAHEAVGDRREDRDRPRQRHRRRDVAD